ncbi:MAG: hypothetical protein ACQETO_10555 [Pseudomonadota bacterium]
MMIRTSTDAPTSLPLILMMAALCLTVLLPVSGQAQDGGNVLRVERFQIDHRDPSGIREALAPLLREQEHIGVIGDWLVVAATNSTRSRIREQLDSLDTPIRRLEVTLSINTPEGQSGDGAPQPVIRDLLVETGQLIRLDLPVAYPTEAAPPTTETETETDNQLSFRLETVQRRLRVSHVIHPADAEVDPDTGTQQRIDTGDWQALDEGIDIRVRPLN